MQLYDLLFLSLHNQVICDVTAGAWGKKILMPYLINQSRREQIELNWIGARVGLWDTALKFLSPGPRSDVTDHLEDHSWLTHDRFSKLKVNANRKEMRKKHAERADRDLGNSTVAKSAQRASIYAFEV